MKGTHGREAAGESAAFGNAAKRKLQRYEGGEKVRYFADDDTTDLATLVRRAKHGDDMHDMDAALADNVARNARYRGKELDVDDEYDVDGGLQMYEERWDITPAEVLRHFWLNPPFYSKSDNYLLFFASQTHS